MRNKIASNSNLLHAIGIGALLLIAATGGARAAGVTVSDAWIRALPRAVPSGGYFTLRNDGPKPVVLTGASSPACGMLMLHKSENHGGMGGMTDVTGIEVPPDTELSFAPGGYHLMCMDAGPAIKPGAVVPVTLSFKDGSTLAAKFQVRNAMGR